MDFGRFLVISIGTGSPKSEQKYNAEMAAKWGVLGWLLHGGSTPLVDVFIQASADMVDFHISMVFQAPHSEENYLRIQVLILLTYMLMFPSVFSFKPLFATILNIFFLNYVKLG